MQAASSPDRRVILRVLWGPLAFRQVTLAPSQVLQVGRAQEMGLRVPHDVELSNAHFELSWDGAVCHLRDLQSTTGTLLGGERVQEATVQNGDWIRAGTTDFSVHFEGLPPSEGAPASAPRDEARHKVLERLAAEAHLFAVLDAARDERILELLRRFPEEHRSLYEGRQGDSLREVAPYLVSLPPGSALLAALVDHAWGEAWGVYLSCPLSFVETRRHLRKFLMVQAEGVESRLYFRFYDPRVLSTFLPTCPAAQREAFLGPLTAFFYEGPAEEGQTPPLIDSRE